MVDSGSRGRRGRRSTAFLALCITTSALAFVASSSQPASAGLSNRTVFNALDKSPTGDVSNGAVAISDPTGNQDSSNFTGSDEYTLCPAIANGTAANKDDLDKIYMGSESNADGVFLYLGWHRISVVGTTTVDYEINQAKDAAPDCNGVSRLRTAGDLLLTFDFHGTGPFTADIEFYEWVGTSAVGTWVGPNPVIAPDFEASISDDGSFGEVVIDLVGAELLGTDGCHSFSSVLPKTRSSSENLGNTIKDWVVPQTKTISNCGSVSIHKQDDTGASLSGVIFDLYTNVGNAPGVAVTPAQNCTTDASGNCTIINVFPGTYWMVERAAPAGHTAAAAQKVTVAVAGNTPAGSLTFVNTRKPAKVNIVKKDDADALLAGAGFTLYTDNAGVIGTAVSGKSCTTNASGECTISNILPVGTYWVRETTTPTGHDTAADQKTTLGLNQTVTLYFTNNRKPAQVDIVKKDDDGAALSGAGFTLYTNVDNAAGTAVSGKSCTTNSSGLCSITNILPPGTYWVRETTTPAGHATAADQKVTLGLNQTLTVNFVNVRKPIDISLDKKVNDTDSTEADPLIVETGSVVTYTVAITNTGELALTLSGLTDTLNPTFAADCPQGNGSVLEAGATFTCTYTSAITAVSNNVASVTGTDVLNRTTSANDGVFVTPINPVIKLDKTGPDGAHVGDVLTYTLTVTNPGDTDLDDVTVTDDTCDTEPALQSKSGGNSDDTLTPGETWTYTCTYTVVADDGDAVDNTAEATGTDVLGKVVDSTDTHTVPVIHPAITIAKTASPESFTGTTSVTFTYVVTNSGDTTLFEIAVTDDILGAIGTIAELAPGASATLTRTVTMGPGSPTTNIGTATGTDVLGGKVTASDPASVAIVLGEVFVRPELPRTGTSVDSQVRWAGLLIGAGLMLVVVTRRRRPTATPASW